MIPPQTPAPLTPCYPEEEIYLNESGGFFSKFFSRTPASKQHVVALASLDPVVGSFVAYSSDGKLRLWKPSSASNPNGVDAAFHVLPADMCSYRNFSTIDVRELKHEKASEVFLSVCGESGGGIMEGAGSLMDYDWHVSSSSSEGDARREGSGASTTSRERNTFRDALSKYLVLGGRRLLLVGVGDGGLVSLREIVTSHSGNCPVLVSLTPSGLFLAYRKWHEQLHEWAGSDLVPLLPPVYEEDGLQKEIVVVIDWLNVLNKEEEGRISAVSEQESSPVDPRTSSGVQLGGSSSDNPAPKSPARSPAPPAKKSSRYRKKGRSSPAGRSGSPADSPGSVLHEHSALTFTKGRDAEYPVFTVRHREAMLYEEEALDPESFNPPANAAEEAAFTTLNLSGAEYDELVRAGRHESSKKILLNDAWEDWSKLWAVRRLLIRGRFSFDVLATVLEAMESRIARSPHERKRQR